MHHINLGESCVWAYSLNYLEDVQHRGFHVSMGKGRNFIYKSLFVDENKMWQWKQIYTIRSEQSNDKNKH